MKSCYTKKISVAYIQDPLFWDCLYLLTKSENEIARKKCLAYSPLLMANIWNQDALTEPGTEHIKDKILSTNKRRSLAQWRQISHTTC